MAHLPGGWGSYSITTDALVYPGGYPGWGILDTFSRGGLCVTQGKSLEPSPWWFSWKTGMHSRQRYTHADQGRHLWII